MMSFVLYDLPLGVIVLLLGVFLWVLFGTKPPAIKKYSRPKRLLLGLPIIWRQVVAPEDQAEIKVYHLKLMLLDSLIAIRLLLGLLLYLSATVPALQP
jgi:hypothetical protein